MPKRAADPPACRSAQASRAACPAGVLGNPFSRAAPSAASRPASRVAFDTSMPATVVAGGAHGVPPLRLTDAGSGRVAARRVASEVEERRRPGRHLVHEVGASRAACG